MKPAITTFAAALLLTRVRLRRSARALTSGFRKRKAKPGTRAETAPKPRQGGVYSALAAAAMFAYALKHAEDFYRSVIRVVVKGAWQAPAHTTNEALAAVAVMFFLLISASLLFTLMNKELANPEWDLEWLSTLPLPTSALLSLRILERALSNTVAALALPPFIIVLGFHMGLGWWSVLLAFVLLLPLLAVLGALETWLEIALRRTLPPSKIRNVQALFSVLAPLTLSAAMLLSLGTQRQTLAVVASRAPTWLLWTPPGLVARVVVSNAGRGFAGVLLFLQAAAVVLASRLWLAHLLRGGLVLDGSRQSQRGLQPHNLRTTSPRGRLRWLSALQRRELRLLLRDRAFMVRTLITPVLVTVFQLAISWQGGADLLSGPKAAAATAFGAAAYSLMFSAYHGIGGEGRALWVLYGLPRSLERIVVEKAVFWAGLAAIFPLAIFLAAWGRAGGGPASASFLPYLMTFLGLPLFAMLATALGAMGATPLEEEPGKRTKLAHAYLYMMLVSTYVYAIVWSPPWPRLVITVLLCAFVFALWQKMRDHLPYLLDPSATPAAAVSLADGLLCTLVFFFVQIIVAYVLIDADSLATTSDLATSYGTAGLASFAAMKINFMVQKSHGQPRYVGGGWRRTLTLGLIAGAAAGSLGVAYAVVVARYKLASPGALNLHGSQAWLIFVAVLLAPVFEEWIFRGLVFGGLKRSMHPLWAATASSVIFAIVHPPASAPVVFVLGMVACWLYQRTGMLLGSAVAHGVYNAFVSLLPGQF